LRVEDRARAEIAAAEEMLAEAYELVVSGWCQGACARDASGRPVEPASVFARQWSAPGALERIWRRAAEGEVGGLDAFERANLALAAAVHGVPQEWNDEPERHQSQVLDALAEAIFLLAIGDAEADLRAAGEAAVGLSAT
jgi:hypothetical protein